MSSEIPASAFSKCLVDPDAKSFAQIRTRRRALGISAFLEISIVAAILIWPLFATGSKLVRRVFIPIPPYSERHSSQRPPEPVHSVAHSTGVAVPCVFCPNTPISPVTPPIFGEHPVPGLPNPAPDLSIGTGITDSAGLIDVFSNEAGPTPPRPEPAPADSPLAPIRRSEGVQAALLIHRIDPRYPALALQTHREGTVQLHAIIARDGSIESLEVLNGDPLFLHNALDAVRQWRYRPTLLGGEPVEVETFITVNFRLAH